MAISDFPNLNPSTFRVTSPADSSYNCIAWSAGDIGNWWWPDLKDSYWPPNVPREETVEAFTEAYRILGYEPCDTPALEPDVEKIALYASADEPTHAARQLADGRWTSKLGPDEDITHDTLESLNCDSYGRPVKFLRRRRRP